MLLLPIFIFPVSVRVCVCEREKDEFWVLSKRLTLKINHHRTKAEYKYFLTMATKGIQNLDMSKQIAYGYPFD